MPKARQTRLGWLSAKSLGNREGRIEKAQPGYRISDSTAARIQNAISDGILAPGARLLAERELAQRLSASRESVREAYRGPFRYRSVSRYALARRRVSSAPARCDTPQGPRQGVQTHAAACPRNPKMGEEKSLKTPFQKITSSRNENGNEFTNLCFLVFL